MNNNETKQNLFKLSMNNAKTIGDTERIIEAMSTEDIKEHITHLQFMKDNYSLTMRDDFFLSALKTHLKYLRTPRSVLGGN